MEQTSYFGSIDLAQLGEIVRTQPNLVKVVTTKDGRQRKFVDVYFNPRKETSQYGHTHYLKVGVKKDEAKEGLNYYIGDFKPNEQQEREATQEDLEQLPF